MDIFKDLPFQDVYQYLERLSDDDLETVCETNDHVTGLMCRMVKADRSTIGLNDGEVYLGGVLPIVESFPSYAEAVKFMEAVKPFWRYSREAKALKDHAMTYREYKNSDNDSVREWTIDDLTKRITDITYRGNPESISIEYLKDDKILQEEIFNLENTLKLKHIYYPDKRILQFEESYDDNGKLQEKVWYDEREHKHRDDGPAKIRYLSSGARLEFFYTHGRLIYTIEFDQNGKVIRNSTSF